MAELEALLTRLPDTAENLQSFPTNFRTKHPQLFSDTAWVDLDDLKEWLGHREDLNHLLYPTISETNVPPIVVDPRSSSGMDGNFGDVTFDPYHPANFYQPRSTTPSSCYSFNPYDEYPASNYSGPSSEVDYFSASGFSTPVSGLDLFNEDNVSEPNLDWDPSLASFFDSVEASASGSGSNPSFLETNGMTSTDSHVPFLIPSADFSSPEPWAAPCSGSNVLFLPANILPFDESALEFTGTNYGKNSTHSNAPFMIRCADLPPPPEKMADASEATSDTVWLDKDVSSDFYIPPQPFPVTKNLKVVRLERVHGIPSQFPVPRVPTAYIVNFSSVRDSYKDANGLPLLRWDPRRTADKSSSDGERAAVCSPWTARNCQGVMFCRSIEESLIDVERYELDSHARDAVNNAQIMQRLRQGNLVSNLFRIFCTTLIPITGSYVNTVRAIKCTGKDSAGGAHERPKVLLCMQQSFQLVEDPFWNPDSSRCRRGFMCSPFSRELITEGELESTSEPCSRIMGSGSGKKGKSECSFPHLKEGKIYAVPMDKRKWEAARTILVPLDEETVPIAIVVPKHLHPHTHPPPPATKVPTDVRLLYERAIRAYGISVATVNKVEQALKRREPGGDKSGWEGLFDLYKADQAKEPRQRYIHSFDFLPGRSPPSAVITTFETVLLHCLNLSILTCLSPSFYLWAHLHGCKGCRRIRVAWDKIHEGFFAAVGKQLAFKVWDPEGWLVTVSGDMEAVPWIGMARSFIKRMDADKHPTVDEFLSKGLLVLKTRLEVGTFSDWVFSLNIRQVTAWWNHKLNHKWILPGLLECLSGLSHEDWLTTPSTSNGNETQHHWTNSRTGIGLNARECILRAAKADHAVGDQFEVSLSSGVMASNRNELSHRTARNAKRHTSAIKKAKQVATGNKKIKELKPS
ncbi:hypothetical protein B0H10DRAFT_1959723 [Mycena sp. CBHHK59/15]|nr:hypothetical protein B0H10DRAFT_1959723 [Mycena sp. CBHHK59/15]